MVKGSPMSDPLPPPTQEPSGRSGLSAVAAVVRRHDRDRYQTALFAPAEAREALFALYAFNYEIARVRESVREPMLGQIRLQWWREAIDAAYGETAPRRHDVVEPLTVAIRTHGLAREDFIRLIDTRERDLDPAPPPTLAALEDYAEGTSARLVQLALEVLDAATPAAKAAATEIGIAYALTGLIRAMPVHVHSGRLMIPDDVAAEAGLDSGDYRTLRTTPGLRRAVGTMARAAAGHLAAARALRLQVPRVALPALLPARIAARTVKRLERAGFDPFSGAGAGDPLQSWRLAFAMLVRRF
jgi:NADH dehydrogenase [ubiquinone] 1 alpha subcomplex assembly factor 6